MDDMEAYYAPPPPPPPPGFHSSLYSHYHPLPSQQSLPPPPPPVVLHPSRHVPPPPLHVPPPSVTSYSHSPIDEVRTLFVAGLPEDVKPREIYNLFREFPGYESSNLRSASKNTQPFAFAVFTDQHSAVSAMHALNGLVFDLEKGSTLYIDLAKSNSRSKRHRADDEGFRSDKKIKGSPAFARGSSDLGVGSFHIPGMSNSAYNTIGYPSSQSYLSFDSKDSNETNAAKLFMNLAEAKHSVMTGVFPSDAQSMNHNSAFHAPQNNPPCPTIFVANLSPNSTEQELIQVFSRCRGFLKLKIQSTYGAPVAFVDFEDTASSTEALNQLQGTILFSSPGAQGMRLEYAKTRMGMRRKPR